MIRKQKGAIAWLEFKLFQGIPGFVHGVFLRHGGVSEGPYTALNMGGGSGDLPENVQANRELVRNLFNLPTLLSSHQTHGDKVHLFSSSSPFDTECDGIMTQEKGAGLLIKHADCQAAIFYDPVHHAVANVHCGWRGNVKNIYAAAVSAMQSAFGSRSEDLLVGISPSLGPEASEFINYKDELPESFWQFQIKPTYFDLWEIARWQLTNAGILPHHIEIAKICTFSNPADFFSYRRDKRTGRHGTLAAVIENNGTVAAIAKH